VVATKQEKRRGKGRGGQEKIIVMGTGRANNNMCSTAGGRALGSEVGFSAARGNKLRYVRQRTKSRVELLIIDEKQQANMFA